MSKLILGAFVSAGQHQTNELFVFRGLRFSCRQEVLVFLFKKSSCSESLRKQTADRIVTQATSAQKAGRVV